MQIIDISVTLNKELVTWENDEVALETKWLSRIADGDSCNLSQVVIGSHSGTHVDAPLHFIEGGRTVDQLDLTSLIGVCHVVEIPGSDCDSITALDCQAAGINRGTLRVLFKTSNTCRKLQQDAKFHDDFVALSPDAAQWLVENGVRTVGIDYLSIGSVADGTIAETHNILLGAGIVVLETLNLENVAPGRYQLIALPLKIEGAEGCPVRAVLITD